MQRVQPNINLEEEALFLRLFREFYKLPFTDPEECTEYPDLQNEYLPTLDHLLYLTASYLVEIEPFCTDMEGYDSPAASFYSRSSFYSRYRKKTNVIEQHQKQHTDFIEQHQKQHQALRKGYEYLVTSFLETRVNYSIIMYLKSTPFVTNFIAAHKDATAENACLWYAKRGLIINFFLPSKEFENLQSDLIVLMEQYDLTKAQREKIINDTNKMLYQDIKQICQDIKQDIKQHPGKQFAFTMKKEDFLKKIEDTALIIMIPYYADFIMNQNQKLINLIFENLGLSFNKKNILLKIIKDQFIDQMKKKPIEYYSMKEPDLQNKLSLIIENIDDDEIKYGQFCLIIKDKFSSKIAKDNLTKNLFSDDIKSFLMPIFIWSQNAKNAGDLRFNVINSFLDTFTKACRYHSPYMENAIRIALITLKNSLAGKRRDDIIDNSKYEKFTEYLGPIQQNFRSHM